MSKKKDRKDETKKAGDRNRGSLADQLKRLEIKPADRDEGPAKKAARAPAAAPRPSPSQSPPSQPESPRTPPEEPAADVPLSDEELLRQAVERMERSEVFRAKYEGVVPSLPPRPAARTDAASDAASGAGGAGEAPGAKPGDGDAIDEDTARELVQQERDRAAFERAVGRVERLDSKYYQPEPGVRRQKQVRAAVGYGDSDGPKSDLLTPSLPRSGEGLHSVGPLDPSQRAMLKRYRKATIGEEAPELNLRGDGLEDALRQLELFVHQCWKEGASFVRIIHGKGLRSEDAPVLKPAVLEWLEGPGRRYIRGYVPEVRSGGDYGSLVVELAARPGASNDA